MGQVGGISCSAPTPTASLTSSGPVLRTPPPCRISNRRSGRRWVVPVTSLCLFHFGYGCDSHQVYLPRLAVLEHGSPHLARLPLPTPFTLAVPSIPLHSNDSAGTDCRVDQACYHNTGHEGVGPHPSMQLRKMETSQGPKAPLCRQLGTSSHQQCIPSQPSS